jgi:hypothetical protein
MQWLQGRWYVYDACDNGTGLRICEDKSITSYCLYVFKDTMYYIRFNGEYFRKDKEKKFDGNCQCLPFCDQIVPKSGNSYLVEFKCLITNINKSTISIEALDGTGTFYLSPNDAKNDKYHFFNKIGEICFNSKCIYTKGQAVGPLRNAKAISQKCYKYEFRKCN